MASGSDEMRPIPVVPDQDWHPHPAAFIFHRQHTSTQQQQQMQLVMQVTQYAAQVHNTDNQRSIHVLRLTCTVRYNAKEDVDDGYMYGG